MVTTSQAAPTAVPDEKESRSVLPKQQPNKKLAGEIIERNNNLKGLRATIDCLNQDIADYVMPRKDQIRRHTTKGEGSLQPDLYNQTAVRAAQVLASGQRDYLISGRWFAYDLPPEIAKGNDQGKLWMQECTEITMRELARSNFNLEVHEMLLDRSAFTHANLFCDEGKRTTLNFRNDDVGTYSIAEDDEGIVDTVFREFKLTARQAVQQFGEENVGKSVLAAAEENTKQDQQFDFVHAVYPRDDEKRNPKRKDGPNKPIASVYVAMLDKIVLRESGYDEMPYAVTRFLKWGNTPYGYSPAIEILPTIRQINFIEKHADALAEIAAFPRILVPDGMAGDVDLRSGGQTVFDPNTPNGKPEEWGTQGSYQITEDRIARKDKAIKDAFFTDLFEMLQQIERQMTAYEVSQRLAEKISGFSPTFDRLNTEVFSPILRRVFSILFRAGKFPPPPNSAYIVSHDGQTARLAMPDVMLTGKLALAIKAAENNAFLQLIQILSPVAQMDPSIMDNFDFDKASRGIAGNLMVPADWQRENADVEAMRQARQQQAAQQQQIANAQAVAKTAATASQADPAKLAQLGAIQ